MTVREIMMRTLAQMNEEADALPEYRDLLLAYINEGFIELSRVQKPFVVEERPCDAEGVLDLARLTHEPTRIDAVLFLGIATAWRVGEVPHTIRVPGCAGRRVSVKYRYACAPLESEAETPDLPLAYQMALSDFATYRMLSNGGKQRQQRADHYHGRYLNAKVRYAPNLGDEESLTIRNKYGFASRA